MERQRSTKKEMAASVGTSRSQLDRVLNPNSDTAQLATPRKVAAVLDKRIKIELIEAA